MNILFSFLGKARQENTPGYRNALYCFDDGREIRTSFFGMGLARQSPPDHFVLMGTPGSMWDVLLDQQTEGFDRHAACLRLLEAAEQQAVNETLLNELKPLIEASVGCPVTLAIIPMGRTEAEQIEILRRMADLVHKDDVVTLDVTHGLRHLPMLGLAATYYLSHVRHARVQEILYGALEMTDTDGRTPVVRLSGLLRVMDWVQTLAAYDKDGDYGPFAPLLEDAGLPRSAARRLRQAAYQERINDIVPARQTLVPLLNEFKQLDSPLAGMFVRELQERLKWVRAQHRDEWELQLGDAYLDRHDYLRAAIHLRESRISREMGDTPDATNHLDREDVASRLRVSADFADLTGMRNCMAHGIRKEVKVLQYLRDESTLRQTLTRIREKLFGSAAAKA